MSDDADGGKRGAVPELDRLELLAAERLAAHPHNPRLAARPASTGATCAQAAGVTIPTIASNGGKLMDTTTDGPAAPPAKDADPFDPAALRLAPDFEAGGVKRVLTTLPVRKPARQEFVRVRPGEQYRIETALLEVNEDREFYLVRPEMRAALAEEIILVRLYVALSRAGAAFFWPVRLPGPDGKRNPWHDSAEKAAIVGMRQWVRLVSNKAAGVYDVYAASAALPEPEWPELGMRELLELAFGERLIASADHPVVRRLRGLA